LVTGNQQNSCWISSWQQKPPASGGILIAQDLHIHTVFSADDRAVVPEQTVAFIASINHARIAGISDHFESILEEHFDAYERAVRQAGLKLGVEVDGHLWAAEAAGYPLDYYIYHCRDQDQDYAAIEVMLNTGRPVIIAHPNSFGTDLNRVPRNCIIEINNRYVWHNDWQAYYAPFADSFKFVLSSDAHQPNWLGQAVARHAADRLGIEEHLVFGGQ
jgi:histidinol phosphatase-like PHP family hydrolase